MFALVLGPIGMVYSTLLGCAVMMLSGGLIAVAYVAFDNPWDISRAGYAQEHALLAPAVWAAVILYWLGCIAWAASATVPSPRRPARKPA